MEGFPDIINTGVVPAEWNAMWEDNDALQTLQPKPVLILSAPYQLGTPEDEQLKKMLGACKLQNEQYNLIIVNDNQLININNILINFKLKTILLLGVLPSQLGISASFAINYPNRFNDCIFIPALSLAQMEKEPAMKSRLWNDALKPVFIENKFGI